MFSLRLSFIVVLLIGRNDSLGEELRAQNNDGFGYELIQSRLDLLEVRFSERFDQLKKQAERVEVTQQQFNGNVERNISQLITIKTLLNSFSERFDQVQKQAEVSQQQFNEVGRNITQLVKGIEDYIGNKVTLMTEQISKLQDRLPNPAGCSKLPKTTSGVCSMNIGGNKTTVYQDHRFGDDWLVVLQRSDGSENFERNWTDYRDGFGTVGQEFWLGLERLHVLTINDSYELLVELEDFDGIYKYARYDKFSIEAEQDLYRLNLLGTYSGTAGDSFKDHKGVQFSTLDKGPRTECVNQWTGGWWYDNCYKSHLTGKWQHKTEWSSIIWWTFGPVEQTPLKFSRMLIRKI